MAFDAPAAEAAASVSVPAPAVKPPAPEPYVPAPSDSDLLAALPTITFTESAPDEVEILDVDAATAQPAAESAASAVPFVVELLPQNEQEMHRRANRVAKVSMQDIQMLKPDQVRLGRENKDLCNRLRDEIEKAHREYERRFQPILGHPVDYFHHWMVEILAGGDESALGAYPYSSPALRH